MPAVQVQIPEPSQLGRRAWTREWIHESIYARLVQRVGPGVDSSMLMHCVFAGQTEERDGGTVRAGCQGDVRGDQGQVTAP